ncbi:hypothetical protein AD940_04030 [Gluconobacter thailandicus]|nr:hypothetical protein AD940_04030 [Gluconobacter thailandicus]
MSSTLGHLIILGLQQPARVSGSDWSEEDRECLRKAEKLVRASQNRIIAGCVLIPVGESEDALARLVRCINEQRDDYWPSPICKEDLGGGFLLLHDLTVPLLWGAEWLREQIFLQTDEAASAAVRALNVFQAQMDLRRQMLVWGGEGELPPCPEEEWRIASLALTRLGEVDTEIWSQKAQPA